jgi:hypothetical protein
MTDVVLVGTVGGQREFLFARPGRYVATGPLWVEIEVALAYGELVYVGAAPSGEQRAVSVDDPETLAAVVASIPGFVAESEPAPPEGPGVAIH